MPLVTLSYQMSSAQRNIYPFFRCRFLNFLNLSNTENSSDSSVFAEVLFKNFTTCEDSKIHSVSTSRYHLSKSLTRHSFACFSSLLLSISQIFKPQFLSTSPPTSQINFFFQLPDILVKFSFHSFISNGVY